MHKLSSIYKKGKRAQIGVRSKHIKNAKLCFIFSLISFGATVYTTYKKTPKIKKKLKEGKKKNKSKKEIALSLVPEVAPIIVGGAATVGSMFGHHWLMAKALVDVTEELQKSTNAWQMADKKQKSLEKSVRENCDEPTREKITKSYGENLRDAFNDPHFHHRTHTYNILWCDLKGVDHVTPIKATSYEMMTAIQNTCVHIMYDGYASLNDFLLYAGADLRDVKPVEMETMQVGWDTDIITWNYSYGITLDLVYAPAISETGRVIEDTYNVTFTTFPSPVADLSMYNV